MPDEERLSLEGQSVQWKAAHSARGRKQQPIAPPSCSREGSDHGGERIESERTAVSESLYRVAPHFPSNEALDALSRVGNSFVTRHGVVASQGEEDQVVSLRTPIRKDERRSLRSCLPRCHQLGERRSRTLRLFGCPRHGGALRGRHRRAKEHVGQNTALAP